MQNCEIQVDEVWTHGLSNVSNLKILIAFLLRLERSHHMFARWVWHIAFGDTIRTCCYAATLPCRQIAHRFRKAAVVAGRNVTKLRDVIKTLSETRRVGPVLIRVRSVSVARGGW